MLYDESEFYKFLFDEIEKDMKVKGYNNPEKLLDKGYAISRTQYYNLKKVVEGNNDIPKFSRPRLLALCKYLNIDIEKVLYQIKDIRP